MQTFVMQSFYMLVTSPHPTFLLPNANHLFEMLPFRWESVAWILIVFRANCALFILKQGFLSHQTLKPMDPSPLSALYGKT